MNSQKRLFPRADLLALVSIAIAATLIAFGLLQAGKRVVQDSGARVVRTTLINESDLVASQSVRELDQQNGCRSAGSFALPYERCVLLSSLANDSVAVVVRIDPRNRLIHADSVSFVLQRGDASTTLH